MSETGAKKCPKCGGGVKRADLGGTNGNGTPVYVGLFLGLWGENRHEILPFYCRNCGYKELYKKDEE